MDWSGVDWSGLECTGVECTGVYRSVLEWTGVDRSGVAHCVDTRVPVFQDELSQLQFLQPIKVNG